MLTQVTAQGDFKIPVVLTYRETPSDRPVTANEIYSNYDALMQNQDTTLGHTKKVAQRWIAHSLPYLNVDTNGFLTNKPINGAFKGIYTSTLQCKGNDLANWESDGPVYMPDWLFGSMQQSGGWVDAVYNNALDTEQLYDLLMEKVHIYTPTTSWWDQTCTDAIRLSGLQKNVETVTYELLENGEKLKAQTICVHSSRFYPVCNPLISISGRLCKQS